MQEIFEIRSAAGELWEMIEIVKSVAAGFECDPGYSDLDDEQPINVTMTLGDFRRACRLMNVSEYRERIQ